MSSFEKVYNDAHKSGLLPGVALIATNKDGSFRYTNRIGVRSLEPREPKHMQLDSVLAMGSCIKLVTAISVLQCVERGQLDLDADVAPLLPEAGKFGVITGFDDAANEAILVPKNSEITLRRLLTHTSGQSYDLWDPLLMKWRASRGEGGGGGYCTTEAYMVLLQAVLKEDAKLLNTGSYAELFKPQLDGQCNKAFNDLLHTDKQKYDYLGLNIPRSVKKNWSFAGMIVQEELPGWMSKNTIIWAGAPCSVWIMDRELGLCGFAGAQVTPLMDPAIIGLHEHFQKGIHEMFKDSQNS